MQDYLFLIAVLMPFLFWLFSSSVNYSLQFQRMSLHYLMFENVLNDFSVEKVLSAKVLNVRSGLSLAILSFFAGTGCHCLKTLIKSY